MQSPSLSDACRNLDGSKIIACIHKGLDKLLGPETIDIVLKILKVVYGLDEKDITSSSLHIVESLLRKTFGEPAARVILEAIANSCREYGKLRCS